MTTVVHLSSVHPAFDTRIFYRECQTLAQRGYAVTLIVPHDRAGVTDDVMIRTVPTPQGRLTRVTCTTWHVFRKAIAEKADIYHFHDPELMGVGLLLKAFTRARIIYDVHEHNPDTISERHWIPKPVRPAVGKAVGLVENLAVRFYDAIITADEDVAERFTGKNAHITTLFNFPLKALYVDHRGPPSQWDLDRRPVTLVYVGVMSGARGLWLMLEALEILVGEYGVDANLLLAGRIPNKEERVRFEGCMNGNQLVSSRVEWLGPIPQSRVAALLAGADIGWVPLQPIPKFHKNIPTKQFEYMAVGLPVVGSDLPPIRRFIEPIQAGILATPADARCHAEAVFRLIQSPTMMREMGENGRQAFLDKYNWDAESRKLVDLYETLADR